MGTAAYFRTRCIRLAGAAVLLVATPDNLPVAGASESGASILALQPRYHRWHVDPGVDWTEENTDYATLDWELPLQQTALVLVDVWDRHYLKDTAARSEAIIGDRLKPLIDACRDSGLQVIHAPSPRQARTHPNWRQGREDARQTPIDKNWPPAAFRQKTGPYAQYQRPPEPRAGELADLRSQIRIHPKLAPTGEEAVVATGSELHELCKERGILFLLYAGFNTNACILTRDYGTMAMSRRGYEVIVVRDCTTGMESCRTKPTLAQTEGAILFLEMFGMYSVTSVEIRHALGEATQLHDK